MKSSIHRSLEPIVLGAAGLTLLAASVAVVPLRSHPTSNWRLAFAYHHLAPALLSSALFCFAAALVYLYFRRPAVPLADRPTAFFLAVLVLLFCAFWLPVLLAAGFAQDDWMLLAAASIRSVVPAHPWLAWLSLDSVDGNFRPLGTVLYFGYAYRFFGLTPLPYLAGNFLLNLASVVIGFLIVRQLGYARITAAAASILFLSRGILYTQVAWASALGDSIVTFLTAVVVLLLLKAFERHGSRATLLHLLAWLAFFTSTLAKQSSFTTPFAVAALLYLRPGVSPPLPRSRRLRQAVAAFVLYGATAGAIFLHAKLLLRTPSPYPLHLTAAGVFSSFSYVLWFLEPVYVPLHSAWAPLIPAFAGLTLVAAVLLLLRRSPRLLGDRPRDLGFLALAAASSVSVFVLLPTRTEAYYGTMLAFWLSLALAILLARAAALGSSRMAAFVLCSLVVLGFVDVRLKQIGLLWSGGYVWGTAEIDGEQRFIHELDGILRANPQQQTAVFIDPPVQAAYYTAMAMLLAPHLQRILVYDTGTGTFQTNDRFGMRPLDTITGLSDIEAYNWRTPMDPARDPAFASTLANSRETIWIRYNNRTFSQAVPLAVAGAVHPPR